jgi:hypothetical protein
MAAPVDSKMNAIQMAKALGLVGAVNIETLAANKTLVDTDCFIQKLDPAGARDLILPSDADARYDGMIFWVINAADAAEDITVKDDGASTIGTVSQNESAVFYNNGGTSWTLLFIVTGAIA